MNFRLAAIAFVCAGLAPRALAQDNTLLFADFESGLPAGWVAGGSPPLQWRLVQNGECGAVTRMMAFNTGAPSCNYAAAGLHGDALLLPPIEFPAGQRPWQIAFDYVLDVDAGDQIGLVVSNPSSQLVFLDQTQHFVNDGGLHSIVLPVPPQTTIGPTTLGVFLFADGAGDLGRGFAVDNVRVTNTATGMIYCDGAAAAPCPCANNAGTWRGCANSLGIGATLRGSGNPSVSADTLRLGVTDAPASAPVLYFEGTSTVSTPFGDGRLCAGGTLVRLAVRFSGSGTSVYPGPGDTPVSVLSSATAGATRHYQALYRDVAGPCSSGFNVSNGWRIVWGL